MRPQRANIGAPELPGRIRWLNAERPPVMAELTASGPVLVHFFDFAQLNSLRALPYVVAWDARYRDAGLTTLGVHSPRFGFTGAAGELAPALDRLGVVHPVADDSGYSIWHDYGVKGWPSLFLWGRGGTMRWFHFGEGEYRATEEAIQDELRELSALTALPAPLEPLRPTDAAGALVAPPSPELFPGGSPREAWAGGVLELAYEAGGAHAALDGRGALAVSVDDEPGQRIEVAGPGLYDIAVHERHERHRLALEPLGGAELYSVSFSAGLP